MYKIEIEIKNCWDCPFHHWWSQDCRRDYYNCSYSDSFLAYDDKKGEAVLDWADGKPTFCPAKENESE